MRHLLFIFISNLILFSFTVKAQGESDDLHEFGIIAGPVFFQSDYGERNSLDNFLKNSGYSIGAFYYLDGQSNYHGIADYIKYRAEMSFMKNQMQHLGKNITSNDNSIETMQLSAMRGSIEALSFGVQIEYYPWKKAEYSYKDWNPYISLGVHYSFYNSKAWSEMGELGSLSITHPKYIDGFQNKSSTAVSLSGSIGTRYQINNSNSLILDMKSHLFMSDWVDGLNPDSRKYPENKANDSMVGINVGYIFTFN